MTAAHHAGATADKLRELDRLDKGGAVTQPEYDAKKAELIKAL